MMTTGFSVLSQYFDTVMVSNNAENQKSLDEKNDRLLMVELVGGAYTLLKNIIMCCCFILVCFNLYYMQEKCILKTCSDHILHLHTFQMKIKHQR